VCLLQLLQEPDQVSFGLLNMMTAVLAQVWSRAVQQSRGSNSAAEDMRWVSASSLLLVQFAPATLC
jgi:hypothetical protein